MIGNNTETLIGKWLVAVSVSAGHAEQHLTVSEIVAVSREVNCTYVWARIEPADKMCGYTYCMCLSLLHISHANNFLFFETRAALDAWLAYIEDDTEKPKFGYTNPAGKH